MLQTLEQKVGLSDGIFDFISKNSSQFELKKLNESRIYSETFEELLDKKDYNSIKKRISQIIDKNNKHGISSILANYSSLRDNYDFSDSQLAVIANSIKKHNFTYHEERVYSKHSKENDSVSLIHPINQLFAPDLMKKCTDRKAIKNLADVISSDLMYDSIFVAEMYASIGDDDSLVKHSQSGLDFDNGFQVIQKIKNNDKRKKALLGLTPETKNELAHFIYEMNNHGVFDMVNDCFSLNDSYKEFEKIFDLALKTDFGVNNLGYSIDKLSVVKKGLKRLGEHYETGTSVDRKKNISRIEGKMKKLVLRCIKEDNPEAFGRIDKFEWHSDKKFQRDMIKTHDKLLKRKITTGAIHVVDEVIHDNGTFHKYDWQVSLSKKDNSKKCGGYAVQAGKYDLAIAFYKQLNANGHLIFDTALEIGKKGDIKQAFKVFEDTDLNKVNTNNNDFYQIVGSSLLSLYVKDKNLDFNEIKEIYNSRVKKGLIKKISVSKGKNLEITVNFDNCKINYKQKTIKGDYRNDVKIFSQNGLSKSKSALKFYKDETHAKTEAEVLKVLKNNSSVVNLIGSGKFEDLYYNQIEICNGTFMNGANYGTLEKCLELGDKIIDEVNSGLNPKTNSDVPLKVDKFSRKFVSDRVKRFGVDGSKLHDILTDEVEEIINTDYAPRNLMIEKGQPVSIDHECYKLGNRMSTAITLVRNPENNITEKQADKLISKYRERNMCSDEYITGIELLWCARQAVHLPSGSKKRNYYENRIEKMKNEFKNNPKYRNITTSDSKGIDLQTKHNSYRSKK